MTFKPLGPTVIIEPVEAKAQTSGGLYIPEQAQEKPQEGIIIALGTGARDKDGKLIPFDVKKGDRVLLSKYGSTTIEADGKKYKLVNVEDILAIIE